MSNKRKINDLEYIKIKDYMDEVLDYKSIVNKEKLTVAFTIAAIVYIIITIDNIYQIGALIIGGIFLYIKLKKLKKYIFIMESMSENEGLNIIEGIVDVETTTADIGEIAIISFDDSKEKIRIPNVLWFKNKERAYIIEKNGKKGLIIKKEVIE